MSYVEGQLVKVKFKGEINHVDEVGNVFVVTKDGYTQRFFTSSADSGYVQVKRSKSEPEVGQLYQDSDGETLRYEGDGKWRGLDGCTMRRGLDWARLEKVTMPFPEARVW